MSAIDGIINLYKPRGISSAKALYRVRKLNGQRKSGHAGTLDPLAEGVLVLCLGQATKLVERIMELPKVYRATARLDVTSISHDSDAALAAVDVPRIPSDAEVRAALAEFVGEIFQTPPVVSALKLNGQPAYRLTRRGTPPVLAPRLVRVYWIELVSFSWPAIEFVMACGRGTYVRALIRDLGVALGTGGCLTGLRRERVGGFSVADSYTFDQLETAASGCVLPITGALGQSNDRLEADPTRCVLPVAAVLAQLSEMTSPPARLRIDA